MSIYKLSLATVLIATLATGASAEESLADAFKNGKINGQLKSFYIDTDYDGDSIDKDAPAVGGIIKYETATFYGVSLGLGVQTSYSNNDDKSDPTNDTTVGITETMVSEAYIDYGFEETTLRYGRSFVYSPLMRSSHSRLVKDFFTGGLVSSEYFENTKIIFGAISDYTTRNNVSDHFDEPVYTLYIDSKMKDFGLKAQANFNNNRDSRVDDGTQDYFFEGSYTVPMQMPLVFAAQYVGFDKDGESLSSLYGLKTELKVSDLLLAAYYTTTPSDNDSFVRGGFGHANDPSYSHLQVLSGKWIGIDSYQAKISYDFKSTGLAGLTAFTRYTQLDNFVSKGNDATEWDLDATYTFKGSMEGLTTQLRYAMITKDSADDFNNLRFRIDYSF